MPKEYYLEIKVFIKQNTNILPNYRSKNHKIKPIEGKQAFFVQNYKLLLKQKTEAIKQYIDEHLDKSFIKLSLLAAIASLLLMRKPSGRLRFCENYRILNKITMKN